MKKEATRALPLHQKPHRRVQNGQASCKKHWQDTLAPSRVSKSTFKLRTGSRRKVSASLSGIGVACMTPLAPHLAPVSEVYPRWTVKNGATTTSDSMCFQDTLFGAGLQGSKKVTIFCGSTLRQTHILVVFLRVKCPVGGVFGERLRGMFFLVQPTLSLVV